LKASRHCRFICELRWLARLLWIARARRAISKLSIQLASYELDATEGKSYPVGVYTQMNNALLGLLKTLGLERKAKSVVDLKTYISRKDKD